MKAFQLPLLLIALVFSSLLFTGCKEDDAPQISNSELRKDEGVVSGPILAAGQHRFGVRFSEADLNAFDGRQLTGISLYIGEAPATLELSAWRGGEVIPGTDVDFIRASQPIPAGDWFTYEFAQPLTIDAATPLWLVAEITLNDTQRSIGCDSGPRKPGGDWLWSEDRWITFFDRTSSSERVNWNIRGIVQ